MLSRVIVCCVIASAVSLRARLPRDVAPGRIAVGETITAPPLLANESHQPNTVEVTLTAAPGRISLRPGVTSDVYAYNGSVPGPTLEAHEGDRVIIHFRNRLAEPTTVHWHGLHIPVDADGSPFVPVQPGAQHDYIFTLKRGSAGTYWYHPHPHMNTGPQIAKGLYGVLIVRANDDPLPATMPERVLVLADNRILPNGAIDLPSVQSPQGRMDHENGREGHQLFVNGRLRPTMSIRSGEVQRWRIINASASRVYRLAIPGQTLLHVGSDGGLFERPVPVRELVIANGERVEVLVRGNGKPGTTTALQTLSYDRYQPETRPPDWNTASDLVRLQYSSEPPTTSPVIPTTLRVVPPLDTLAASARRTISFGQGLINGKTMDVARVDVHAKLGATEIWTVENLVRMDHPFHLHGFQFQVIDRNGVPEKFRSWKDMINVPKHEVVRFVVRFDDYAGKWMFHCHILDHEDQGMMGILEVK